MDLKRPERFLLILTRPNWTSWMARGAFLLTGHGMIAGLWLVLGLAGWHGGITALAWLTLPVALAATAYTGFLFAQGLARDLWQGTHATIDLVAQALVEGAAVLLVAALVLPAAAAEPVSPLVSPQWLKQHVSDPGVLVLSRFAGAAIQLRDALLINPYSAEEVSDAICQALNMPLEAFRALPDHLKPLLMRAYSQIVRAKAFAAAQNQAGN